MKKIIPIIIAIGLTLILAGNVLAAEIAWLHVQHRAYGTGKTINRLSFGLVDEEFNYVTGKALLEEVKLTDPFGQPVELSAVDFGSVEEIYGNYDAKNSQWYYDKNWQYDSWFSLDIQAPLVAGTYILRVTTTGGRKTERAYTFNQRVDLPIIDSASLKLRPDSGGNLIWTWDIPDRLGRLSRTHPMRARASIDIYSSDRYSGYFSIIVPVHLGFVFVPREVAQKINRKGNRFEVMITLETRDKNNRTYSKPVGFKQILPPSSSS